jgi:hypothetical protein
MARLGFHAPLKMAPILLLLAVFAGCERALPTGVENTSVAHVPEAAALLKVGVAFECRGSARSGKGVAPWRYGRAVVRFAPEEVAENGATVHYRFSGYEDGTRLISTAECTIPRTDAAIRRMDANFGIRRAPLASAGRSRIPGPRMDCTGENCSLPGVIGTACSWGGVWPYCYSKPTSLAQVQCGALDPACGGTGGGTPDDPWTWDGGGGSDPTAPESCDPAVDPACEKPLTNIDVDAIRHALTTFVRPDTAIHDSTARVECAEMRRTFESTLGAGNVFRGAYDSQSPDEHYGMSLSGHIHFDPWLLNSAAGGNVNDQRELANTALHEAAHVAGHHHPNAPQLIDGYDVYSDPYFNLLSPGPNTCIKY